MKFYAFLVVSTFISSWSFAYKPTFPSSPIQGSTQTFIVQSEIPRQRLDQYLVSKFPGLSRSFIGSLCEEGYVTVNQFKQPKNYNISPNDEISVTLSCPEVATVAPENIPLDILFEDEHILAVNKPAGMVIHPAPGSPNGTFVNALLNYLGDKASALMDFSKKDLESGITDNEEDELEMFLEEAVGVATEGIPQLRPGIVHRLDKGTSGVLLAAKHPEAVTKLSALFANRKIQKTYLAICVGNPGEATIVEPIARSTKNRQIMAVFDGPPGGATPNNLLRNCMSLNKLYV